MSMEWRYGGMLDDEQVEQYHEFCERPLPRIKWDRWVVWCVLVPLCAIAVYSVGTVVYYELFHHFVK